MQKRLNLLAVFFIKSCLLPIIISSGEPEIDLYCLYTPSFQRMYEEFFLPSIQDPFRIIARECPQECPSSVYGSFGWKNTMGKKLDLLIEAVKDHWNDGFFIYSDIDIIFLRPILPLIRSCLAEHDFVVQQGWPRDGLCAGFLAMRGNDKTLELLQRTLVYFAEEKFSEQQALQKALDSLASHEISWAYLPIASFPNGAYVLRSPDMRKLGRYQKDSEIILDPSIALFHANCCVGIENKLHFIYRVQEIFRNMPQ